MSSRRALNTTTYGIISLRQDVLFVRQVRLRFAVRGPTAGRFSIRLLAENIHVHLILEETLMRMSYLAGSTQGRSEVAGAKARAFGG